MQISQKVWPQCVVVAATIYLRQIGQMKSWFSCLMSVRFDKLVWIMLGFSMSSLLFSSFCSWFAVKKCINLFFLKKNTFPFWLVIYFIQTEIILFIFFKKIIIAWKNFERVVMNLFSDIVGRSFDEFWGDNKFLLNFFLLIEKGHK